MTYASKRALRERNEWLQTRVQEAEERAYEKNQRIYNLQSEHRAEIRRNQSAYREQLENERAQRIEDVRTVVNDYRELKAAVFAFYGVTADELLAAQATQDQLVEQKLLKDNLKKVKNANKTEEGK